MTDKVKDCVSNIVAIARGNGTFEEKRGKAAIQIDRFLRDAVTQTGGSFGALQYLRDELGRELNLRHGSTRQFLDEIVDYIDKLPLARD